jgi:uncharacterized membrane protein YsdA (DUF1294 family)
MPPPSIVIAAWYALCSVAAFIAFGVDKRAAQRGRRRVPERALHALEFLGGVPGAWVAIVLLRHKSRKPQFLAITAAITLLHACLWFLIARR